MSKDQAVTIEVNQVGATMFGMLSNMVISLTTTVITTATKATVFIDKSMNIGINMASAGENITNAIDKRSASYGAGMVRNGELSERASSLQYRIRLMNLEKQEAAGPQPLPEPEEVEEVISADVIESVPDKKPKRNKK